MSSTTNLTEFFIEKAEKELGENETRKSQSLDQFRDWIKLQPHIKHCRQDDNFLLRFLRVRKYVFMNATKNFENYMTSVIIFPQYFSGLDIKDPCLIELLDTGYFLIMPNRSKDGERIVMLRPQAFDLDKFSALLSFRLHFLGVHSFLEEEETQISGIKYIVDFTNLPLNFLGLFTLTDYKNLIDLVQNALPLRLKSVYFVNLPGFANAILQFIMSLMNEKMKERVKFFKNLEELKAELGDDDLLPKEYGGTIPISEVTENMKETFEERRDMIIQSIESEFIVKNIPKWASSSCSELDSGAEGSFRQLQID